MARTCAKTPRDLEKGMECVKHCLRIIWECQYQTPLNTRKGQLKFWAIENPATGMLKYFLGKPTFEYCPHEYGADFTKRTALWGYFNIPKKPWWGLHKPKGRSLAGDMTSKILIKSDEERMHIRSKCYFPFANAFFLENQ